MPDMNGMNEDTNYELNEDTRHEQNEWRYQLWTEWRYQTWMKWMKIPIMNWMKIPDMNEMNEDTNYELNEDTRHERNEWRYQLWTEWRYQTWTEWIKIPIMNWMKIPDMNRMNEDTSYELNEDTRHERNEWRYQLWTEWRYQTWTKWMKMPVMNWMKIPDMNGMNEDISYELNEDTRHERNEWRYQLWTEWRCQTWTVVCCAVVLKMVAVCVSLWGVRFLQCIAEQQSGHLGCDLVTLGYFFLMFWRTDVPSSATLNSSEPHIRWPSVTIPGPGSSATLLREPQMLPVSVVLTISFETHISCVWCSKDLWDDGSDEVSVFSTCSCDSSQHSILVSCTDQTEPAQWCCVELRPQQLVWIFFCVLYDLVSPSICGLTIKFANSLW